jgi:hypothetical protein
MTQTEMIVEFKNAVGDDAFNDKGPFEHNSTNARDTLGQVTLYATAHQAAQFRIHVFLVLVFPKYARFMRWDRSGVIVTERVPFQIFPMSTSSGGLITPALPHVVSIVRPQNFHTTTLAW